MSYTVDEYTDYQIISEKEMRESARYWLEVGVDFNYFLGDNDTYGESPSIHPPGADGVGYIWLERELESIWCDEGGTI